jgi:hypothetical protein
VMGQQRDGERVSEGLMSSSTLLTRNSSEM